MFKQITACVLLVAISLHILQRAVIYIDYYTNTSAYAKNCRNKARPAMHCNGKCQLMKKLQQEEKKDGQVPAERKSGNNDVISSRSFFTATSHFIALTKPDYNVCQVSHATDRPRFCFHPPGI